MVFRYAFGRWWGNTDLATSAIWVLLNPATGDTERRHRPTLERCISASRAAGHTGLVIVNLFAFRDTDPRNLRAAPDAIGPANDEVLRVITTAGAQTIAAWGGSGRLNGRSAQVGPLLDSPMCLGTTQGGEPRHPLYVAASTQLVPWVLPRPASSAEDGVNHHVTAAALLPHPPVVARDTVGALFDREPVQFSLRGDAYLWRELRAQFATTPLPSDWYELRQLLQGGVDKVVGDLLASRESLGWHDPDAAVYVPAYDPGHGISAGAVHLPWWSHTGIPILLDRFQAQRLPEVTAEAD
ncbi:DUF1643 domain-containing protein [Knoellia sp. S7-12]|uniref:DUF1643 domain-containing protein n=1 Tax=Knoellia sp. S7-12 TaxID=3126698 RepID=UPI00336931C5